MSSPSTPVKFCWPVRPKRMALAVCECGGMISFGSFCRYAVYRVDTVARRGASPGLTRISERRSVFSVEISRADSASRGWISSL
ncbi:hypothetical protein D3C72_2216460 [compost metagenome]